MSKDGEFNQPPENPSTIDPQAEHHPNLVQIPTPFSTAAQPPPPIEKHSNKGRWLLLFLIVLVAAGVGVYVYLANNKANNDLSSAENTSVTAKKAAVKQKVVDETATWLSFNAPNKKYFIKIPDGWNLVSLDDGSAPYALTSDKIIYTKGVKATVSKSTDREVVVTVFSMKYTSDFDGSEPFGKKSKEYTTKSGYQVIQYKYFSTEDSPGLPKGSTYYEYRITSQGKGLLIQYSAEVDAVNQVPYIESAIGTLKFY